MAIKVPRDIVKKGKYEIQWNPYVVDDINNRLRNFYLKNTKCM